MARKSGLVPDSRCFHATSGLPSLGHGVDCLCRVIQVAAIILTTMDELARTVQAGFEENHLVLFDGVCNFCSASVQFIIRRDRRKLYRFVPIQSPLGRRLYSAAGLDPDRMQTIMLLKEGRSFVRSDAAIEIARGFGGIWRMVVVFRCLPAPLRDWVYSFIAVRRYRWFGSKPVCEIPAPEVRERFLA